MLKLINVNNFILIAIVIFNDKVIVFNYSKSHFDCLVKLYRIHILFIFNRATLRSLGLVSLYTTNQFTLKYISLLNISDNTNIKMPSFFNQAVVMVNNMVN